MHIEKVRFDEVFDVAAQRGDFSFRSQDRVQYGVRLGQHVIPRAGASFAIAFAEPGKWDTILGWRELASPHVTLAHPTWSFWFLGLSDILLVGLALIALALLLAGPVGALVATAAVVGIALFPAIRFMRLNRAVKRALLAAGGDEGQACTMGSAMGR